MELWNIGTLFELDVPDAVAHADSRAEGLRQRNQVRQNLLRQLTLGQFWPAALAPRLSEAERDRVQRDLGEVLPGEAGHGDEGLPNHAIRREAALVEVVPRVVEVVDGSVGAEPIGLVVFAGQAQQRF